MKKNEEYQIRIDDMGVNGEGIGKVDGITLFVKDALIGDVARVKIMKMKKQYGFARLMEVLEPSPWRVEPKCQFHRQCGGCQIQALSYEKQLEFKQNKVLGNLQRIGGFTEIPMEPIVGMEEPWHYRNKAQFPVGKDKEGNLITGFYAGRTHQIIPNRDCALGVSVNREILDIVLDTMTDEGVEAYDEETGKGLVRHILIRYGFKTGEIMVCLVINGDTLKSAEKFVDKLVQIPGMTLWAIQSKCFGDRAISQTISEALSIRSLRCRSIRSTRCRQRSCTDWHWNMQGLPVTKSCGICIVASERSPCFLPRKQNRFMEWRSFRRQSKMQKIMRRSTVSKMQNFMWEKQRRSYRIIIQNMRKPITERLPMQM